MRIMRVVLSVLAFAVCAFAQDEVPTKVTPQNRTGDLPYSTSIGTDVERVDVLSGNLMLNIPIAHVPGRGMDFNFELHYDSRFFVSVDRGQYEYWNIERRPYLIAGGLGWSPNQPYLTWTDTTQTCAPNVWEPIEGDHSRQQRDTFLFTGNYIFTDTNGTKHPLPTLSQANPQCDWGTYWIENNQGPDSTAAGIWADTTGPIYLPGGVQLLPGGLQVYPWYTHDSLLKQDTYAQPLGVYVDSNGNTKQEFAGGLDTLGRTIVTEQDAPNQITYSVRDSNGALAPYVISFIDQTITTSFNATTVRYDPYIRELAPTTRKLVSSIQLPNGTSYTFQYDNYGHITHLTIPSGATIDYNWAILQHGGQTYRYVTRRSVHAGGQTSVWTMTHDWGDCDIPGNLNPSSQCEVVTLIDPANQISTYAKDQVNELVQVVKVGISGTHPMRRFDIKYVGSGSDALPLPTQIRTTLEDGATFSVNTFTYDSLSAWYDACYDEFWCEQYGWPSHASLFASRGLLTDINEYAWNVDASAPGAAPLRHKHHDYVVPTIPTVLEYGDPRACPFTTLDCSDQQAAGFWNARITNLVSKSTTCAASECNDSNKAAQTSYTYDARGNALTVSRYLDKQPPADPTTTYAYDNYGNITSIIDPDRHETTFAYDNPGAYADGACPTTGPSGYVSQIKNALGQIVQRKYYSCTGLLQSRLDPNDIAAGRQGTKYTYDNMGLKRSTNFPDGGWTTLDTNGYAMPLKLTETRGTGSDYLVTETQMDELGRVVDVHSSDRDSECTGGWIHVGTSYDLLGRKQMVTNPYCSNEDSTYGETWYAYDVLNRPTSVTNPDNTVAVTSYNLRATTASDESGVTRVTQADALGRLTSVCEKTSIPLRYPTDGENNLTADASPTSCGLDAPATGFLTTYGYNILDNLTNVTQGAITRTFEYDSLSRLKAATNPESGTTRYDYDADGNVTTRTRPAANQTSPQTVITTTYAYDPLHRNKAIAYSDGVTPAVTLSYDTDPGNISPKPTNTIGRLVKGSTSTVPNGFVRSYDEVGRLTHEWQSTPVTGSNYRDLAYWYDLVGNPTQATDGIVVTYQYHYATDGSGRLRSLTSSYGDSTHPPVLLQEMHYSPAGALKTAALGNGLTQIANYDNRLRLRSSTVGSGICEDKADVDGLKLTDCTNRNYRIGRINYAGNGNVTDADDNVNGFWTYAYDDLNRLVQASSGLETAYTYEYDRFGNRWRQMPTNGNGVVLSFNTKNQISTDAQYDAAGNVTQYGNIYRYDAENRLICAGVVGVDGQCQGTSFAYDALGRRIEKRGAGYTDDYLYDSQGRAITGLHAGNGWRRGEVYAGSLHVGSYDDKFYFSHGDWLGTERMRTGPDGTVSQTCTSLPFGDNLSCSNGSQEAPSDKHFTGKERDTETGLDYFGARYYGSNMGRWMSPDWSSAPEPVPYADLTDPQTLNLYGYVRNNPLATADADGHCWPPSACADKVDSWVQTFRQDGLSANSLTSSPSLVFLNTFANGVTADLASGAADVLRLGNGTSAAIDSAKQGDYAGAAIGLAQDGGRAAGVILAVTGVAANGEAPTVKEGVYEGPDATAPGRTYVGQSENIPRRLGEHEASGKFPAGTKVKSTEVKGGKTAREIAEQKRINQLGGVRSNPGSKTSNIRNPIGKNRAHLMKDDQ